ncbi:Condensation domain-containing protein, partial [Andreprevotia lacus DSM 23236]
GDPYLLPSLFGFESRELLERFVERVQQVVDRHDILRTRLAWENLAQPVQVVLRKAELPVHTLQFDAANGTVLNQLQRYFDPAHTRIDLRQAPLLRCHVVEDAANGRWVLHLLAHHLVIDHTTMDILLEETRQLDQGEVLPAAVPYRQFVAQARLGISKDEHEAFFKAMLAHIDAPTAPFDLLNVQNDGSSIVESKLRLDDAVAKAVRQQARAHGVSAASLLHLAWALVLARTTGRDDVVFGTVLFGRMQGGEQADRGIGLFINSLPIRVGIGGENVASSLKAAHALLAQLMRHEHAPLALAQRCSGVAAPAPLFTSLVNYRYSPDLDEVSPQYISGQGVYADIEALGVYERTNYPLTLAIDDLGEGFQLTAQVAQPIAPQRICQFMQAAVEQLVAALQQQPNQPLAQLD